MVRQRALDSGWLRERFVPHPSLLGLDVVRVSLWKPFAEYRDQCLSEMLQRPGLVNLWASGEMLFSIEFDVADQRPSSNHEDAQGIRGSVPRLAQAWTVTARISPDSIPIYFDFAGAWSRFTRDSPAPGYPMGLLPLDASTLRGVGHSDPTLFEVRELLVRPHRTQSGTSAWIGGFRRRHTRLQRELLRQKCVFRRVLPRFQDIPPFEGRRVTTFRFVTGKRVARSGSMVARIMAEANLHPFFAAMDESRVILALVSSDRDDTGRTDSPPVPVFAEELRQIEITSESVYSMLPLVDHRYERLIVDRDELNSDLPSGGFGERVAARDPR